MKRFKLHWLDGKIETVEGTDINDACMKAGLGQGAMRAMDYWEEITGTIVSNDIVEPED